ncbi:MAG: RNA polymerase sigma-70 factor [Bacteroidota bacterium]
MELGNFYLIDKMDSAREKNMVELLKSGDTQSLKSLFDTYYPSLCSFALQFLNDHAQAEEVVQDLFVRLWENRSHLEIKTSLKSYLFRSVRNQCLNLIQHEKVRQMHAEKIREALFAEDVSDHFFLEGEIAAGIQSAIEEMPEKRREIFRLNREEGLKYKEIAEKLNISVKTVETHMGLALKSLRDKLRHFFLFLFFSGKKI